MPDGRLLVEVSERVDLLAAKGCEECDETGLVYEPCHCYSCEYDDHHGGDRPCFQCQEALLVQLDREAYERGQ